MGIIEAAYRNFCKERFSLPTEQQIADLERRIGVALPQDYREFILGYNGGYFDEPNIVPVIEGCPRDGLDSLFGIGSTHPSSELASEFYLDLFDDNYPVEVLPIGGTPLGALILLITHPEDRGAIMLKVAFGDSYFLARGIDGFFERLREPEAG